MRTDVKDAGAEPEQDGWPWDDPRLEIDLDLLALERADVDIDLVALEREAAQPVQPVQRAERAGGRLDRWRAGAIGAAFRDLEHDIPSFDSAFWSDVAVVPHECSIAEHPPRPRRLSLRRRAR